jgi:endonuclease/exonuclease/phosphatase family metal-dependent hydrolase
MLYGSVPPMRRLGLAVIVTIMAAVGALWMQLPQRAARLTGRTDPGRLPSTARCEAPCGPSTVTVMTLNVLCRFCAKEGYDEWSVRLPQLQALITRHSPDLIGLQEVADIDDAVALLEGGGYRISSARWGGEHYTDALLAFQEDRMALIDEGALWLSPTPELPLSWGWRPLAFPRLVAWAQLRDRDSGLPILLATTHLDNNRPNKDRGAALIGEQIVPLAAGVPLILTGDLNTHAREDRFPTILGPLTEVSTVAAETQLLGVRTGVPHTRRELQPDRRIDHILVGSPGDVSVSRWIHDAPVYGDPLRRPSDHPAVLATITLGPVE